MLAISFLGLGKFNKEKNLYEYEETKYFFNDKTVYTCYFPFAVKEFTAPDKLVVIMTEKASNEHSDRLSLNCEFDSIIIPEGKTEKEIWEIFSKITDYIAENSEVVVDITHGFRSQPVILLASLVYLKALKNVKIKKILYAAFEARDENNKTPVFDLKPFLDLMDWSYGVYEFINNGNSKEFKNLLINAHRNSYLVKNAEKAEKLTNAGNILEKFTNALSLVNIKDALKFIAEYKNIVPQITMDSEKIAEAKPFNLLLNKISQKLESIGEQYTENKGEEFIKSNIEIIKWYLETEQYQQAITLMNECFISFHCCNQNRNIYLLGDREIVNRELGCLTPNNRKENTEYSAYELRTGELWNNLSQLRNKVNHAFMRKENEKSSTVINKIIAYFEELVEYINYNK